jgi:ABC-type glycerol-3-phosphate transport system substrate-binding protein
MSKGGANLEEAWALLLTVVSKEGVRLEAISGEAPPSRKSVAYGKEYLEPNAPPGRAMRVVVEALEVLRPDVPLVNGPEFEETLATGLQPLWDGQQTARQALAAVRPRVETLLATE